MPLNFLSSTGEYEKAIELREESLRLSQNLRLRPDIGRALIGQAKAYTLMGHLDRARELLFAAGTATRDRSEA